MSLMSLVSVGPSSKHLRCAAPCSLEGPCPGYGSRESCPPLIVLAVRETLEKLKTMRGWLPLRGGRTEEPGADRS
jgi:predicted metal-binding protein